ncbi:MAG: iron-dependent repressor [Saprospiraceae bacterium]|nr:MAG: iron-dependent repressor [Saprospiraceae bacterium]
MESLSQAEENYLKAIYKLSEERDGVATTNAIAEQMQTTAASVTDMLKRLSAKGLIHYEKHRGATLSEEGRPLALYLVRKHRIWETFLVKTLGFSWDEVHEIAEQLEHIRSADLIRRLDAFLGHPRFDPHGDPIPDADGNIQSLRAVPLSEVEAGKTVVVVGVSYHEPAFLQFLDRLGIGLGTRLAVEEQFDFDQTVRVRLPNDTDTVLAGKVSSHLLVQPAPKANAKPNEP